MKVPVENRRRRVKEMPLCSVGYISNGALAASNNWELLVWLEAPVYDSDAPGWLMPIARQMDGTYCVCEDDIEGLTFECGVPFPMMYTPVDLVSAKEMYKLIQAEEHA